MLLRGLTREAGHWGDLPDRFRAVFPDDEVTAVDLPGCGTRWRERAPASVGATLEAVRSVVAGSAESGVSAGSALQGRPVSLFALSLGGMVAHQWLRQYPDEVACAVLVNTSVGGISSSWRRMRPQAARAVLAALLTDDVWQRETRIYGLTSGRPERRDDVVARWCALYHDHPVSRITALRQLLAAARYRVSPPNGAAPPPAPPTLLLVSARDGIVDPSCSYALARSLGAELREHPSAGHDLPLDDPEWVLSAVAGWLDPPLKSTGPPIL